MKENLGVIAAKGVLPMMVADHSNSRSIVACIEGLARTEDFDDHIAKEFPIGKINALFEYFKSHDVTNIVICGNMQRPDFSSISVDTKGAILLAKILAAKFLGDDTLLSIVAQYIEQNGFIIKSPAEYLSKEKIVTITKPSKRNLQDINVGIKAVDVLGSLDIGQAVIVENGVIISVEAAEGTDMLIQRSKPLLKKQKSGVLIKAMKPTQDPRLDTPVIGVKTVLAACENGLSGIAIERGTVIVIDPQKVVATANKLGIFIIEINK